MRLSIAQLATIPFLLLPALAGAQSSQGAIGVAATILPAPPAPPATPVSIEVDAHGNALVRLLAPRADAGAGPALPTATFLRLTRDADGRDGRAFVAPSPARGVELAVPLPALARDSSLRVERLIVAGT